MTTVVAPPPSSRLRTRVHGPPAGDRQFARLPTRLLSTAGPFLSGIFSGF
jgi:hypothetical protein